MTVQQRRLIHAAGWVLVVIPSIIQLVLLVTAIAGRIGYPYDLEWMEGGLLHHAQRISDGQPLYAPPSIEFIPYLYTPLYPAVLAMLGKVFGLGYTLGRVISVLSLVGIALIALVPAIREREQPRGPAWAGAFIALGLFAATYPYVEGWFDLVRGDTLFLLMVTAGIAALPGWARSEGLAGHGRVAAGAALLALSFFCKQTGIFYVAFGGAIVAVVAWRRTATYVAVAGVIGLGFTALFDSVTGGWFWIYVSKIHRAHDFDMHRFWSSFGHILWHFPALTIVVVLALVIVLVTWRLTGELPARAKPLLLWSAAFAVSTVVGAVGWGTEFARFNAYVPALLHGALAAGAAIPAVAACVRQWHDSETAPTAASAVLALALAGTLMTTRWKPSDFVPTDADVAAGDALIAHLHGLEGDVWMPSHPWYLVLAGKAPHVHRMGITDVTRREPRPVAGLDEALRTHRFSAIVLDNRDLQTELPQLRATYHAAVKLPNKEQPKVYSGAGGLHIPREAPLYPDTIWVPAIPATPPRGARALFDFEGGSWAGWIRSGGAWGEGPAAEPLPGQDLVAGATGVRFATSMHGGDSATGRVTSPEFEIDGAKLTLMLGGGSDATKLRVELWVDGAIVRTAGVPMPGGDTLREASWDVSELRGKQGRLVLVDDATTSGGHMDVDDIWLWAAP